MDAEVDGDGEVRFRPAGLGGAFAWAAAPCTVGRVEERPDVRRGAGFRTRSGFRRKPRKARICWGSRRSVRVRTGQKTSGRTRNGWQYGWQWAANAIRPEAERGQRPSRSRCRRSQRSARPRGGSEGPAASRAVDLDIAVHGGVGAVPRAGAIGPNLGHRSSRRGARVPIVWCATQPPRHARSTAGRPSSNWHASWMSTCVTCPRRRGECWAWSPVGRVIASLRCPPTSAGRSPTRSGSAHSRHSLACSKAMTSPNPNDMVEPRCDSGGIVRPIRRT